MQHSQLKLQIFWLWRVEHVLNKKGIENLIAWVLLVGLSVSLAALVTTWAIDNARDIDFRGQNNIDIYCPDVSIIINTNNTGCYIRNTGRYSISKMMISTNTGSNQITLQPALNPGEINEYAINCQAGNRYIPIMINEKGEDVVCVTKRATL